MVEKSDNKIYRFPKVGWFGGVAAGIAYRFKVQAWIVRLILFLIIIGGGVGLLAYIFCWIFMPEAETPEDYKKVCE